MPHLRALSSFPSLSSLWSLRELNFIRRYAALCGIMRFYRTFSASHHSSCTHPAGRLELEFWSFSGLPAVALAKAAACELVSLVLSPRSSRPSRDPYQVEQQTLRFTPGRAKVKAGRGVDVCITHSCLIPSNKNAAKWTRFPGSEAFPSTINPQPSTVLGRDHAPRDQSNADTQTRNAVPRLQLETEN
jgi:hypothetical protein